MGCVDRFSEMVYLLHAQQSHFLLRVPYSADLIQLTVVVPRVSTVVVPRVRTTEVPLIKVLHCL